MKKAGFIILLSIFSYIIYAQLKPDELFLKKEVVWYGLDFSKSKFIGRFENVKGVFPSNANEIVTKYIPAWNDLIVNEPYDYDLQNAFRKKLVYYHLKPVDSINSKISALDLITLNSNSILKTDLPGMVASYTNGSKTQGLGLVFIIENFNKPRRIASLWVVFFDIETKKILLSKYCTGEPVGFGLRNYWAGSFKHILKDIRYNKFEKWSREDPNEVSTTTVRK